MYETDSEVSEPQRQLDEVASFISMANAKVKEYTEEGRMAEERAKISFACAEIWQRVVTGYGKSDPHEVEMKRGR
jgi:hypothetical protein